MAVSSNLSSLSPEGNREDLIEKTFDTSPREHPLHRRSLLYGHLQIFHEWQRDALGAASADNAMIDGDDATMTAQVVIYRVGNYLQRFQ